MNKFLLPILFGFLGCTTHQRDASAFEGTYAREVTDELGTLWDTLRVSSPAEGKGRLFLISKSSRVVNRDDGGLELPPVRRQVAMAAVYNAESGTMDITQTGEQYLLTPGDTALFNGYFTYTRLK